MNIVGDGVFPIAYEVSPKIIKDGIHLYPPFSFFPKIKEVILQISEFHHKLLVPCQKYKFACRQLNTLVVNQPTPFPWLEKACPANRRGFGMGA